jgi:hypothetical protein
VRLPWPLVCIELEEAAFCTFDWANSELIAAGMANGIQPHRLDNVSPATQALVSVIVVHYLRQALGSKMSEREPPLSFFGLNTKPCFMYNHLTHRLLLHTSVCDPCSRLAACT